jgi:hypothetical protein
MHQFPLSISDVTLLIGIPIAIIGIFLTWRQLKLGYEIQKATYFKELYLMFFADRDIIETFYLIDQKRLDWNHFWGTPEEKQVDRLLSHITLVCGLYFAGMLTRKEMNFFKYEFLVVYKNECIQKYFEHLQNASSAGPGVFPFTSFIQYCKAELSSSAR